MKGQEETKAAVLWAFIERVRQEESAVVEGLSGLAPVDVEHLARLLQTAVGVRRAFDEQASEVGSGAAERVRAAIAARQRGEPASTYAARRSVTSWLPALTRRPLVAGL